MYRLIINKIIQKIKLSKTWAIIIIKFINKIE
jgi:hypothetical protein